MIEVKSKYQCPKCKINLDFDFSTMGCISISWKKRYKLNTDKDYMVARCPKCFKEYALEE